MANAIPVPEQPGRLFIPKTGDVIQQESTYEGSFYDTVEFTTFVAGTKGDFFKVQTNKELQDTNLTQAKRIPSYSKMKLMRLGLHVRGWVGTARPSPEDVCAIYDRASLRFLLGSTNLIAEGIAFQFPSGYGLTGISTANNFTQLSSGVASAAAAPRLSEQQDINDKTDLNCSLRTDAQTWLSGDSTQPTMVGNGALAHIAVLVAMVGVITRPLGS